MEMKARRGIDPLEAAKVLVADMAEWLDITEQEAADELARSLTAPVASPLVERGP